jgi:hypothetical protein
LAELVAAGAAGGSPAGEEDALHCRVGHQALAKVGRAVGEEGSSSTGTMSVCWWVQQWAQAEPLMGQWAPAAECMAGGVCCEIGQCCVWLP